MLSFVTALAFAGMGWQMPSSSRPELMIAFGMSLALISRAVFIPSTPLRTAVVSGLCSVPVVAHAYLYYSRNASAMGLASPVAYSLLAHPNTVSVFDFGRTPDGVFYYAMEYLDGIDLELLVRHAGPLPPARVVYCWSRPAAR